MPIPKYEEMMLPFLQFLGDKQDHRLSEVYEHLYEVFHTTEEEKKELTPSGEDRVFPNRVRWAKLYLERAGLIEVPLKGTYRITKTGSSVLKEQPQQINVKYLTRFPDFVRFKFPKGENKISRETLGTGRETTESLNPMELLEDAYVKIKGELAEELLRELKKASPIFFENVVVELLVKMGYGGSKKDAGQAIGRSGDEGIDGIIKEDRLGLDGIYLQAKRWEGTVGRPEVHKFVGALKGQGANKGIFITTSNFSKDALEYASKIDSPKIVLIDGQKFAELMIEHGVGVSEVTRFEIKRIDQDYFIEG